MNKIDMTVGTVKMLKNYGHNSFKINNSESIKILEEALKKGVTKLDTAESYGKIEKIIPESLLNCFEITSKINISEKNPIEQIETFFNKNKHVRKLLIHNADIIFMNNHEEILFKCSNYFKSMFGLSMYSPIYTEVAMENGIKNFQIPCNILDNRWDFFRNKKTNVYVEARSVFLQGILLKKNISLPKLLFSDYIKAVEEIDKISEKIDLNRLEVLLLGASKKYVNSLVLGVSSHNQFIKSYLAFKKIKDMNMNLNVSTNNINLLDPRKW
jgi:aryl-alcohol dehydrogenase-like predicted oxidoreductase